MPPTKPPRLRRGSPAGRITISTSRRLRRRGSIRSRVLELVRTFDATPRLMGYGVLLALLGCAPRPTACFGWVAYGAACFGAAVLNTVLVDSIGAATCDICRSVMTTHSLGRRMGLSMRHLTTCFSLVVQIAIASVS